MCRGIHKENSSQMKAHPIFLSSEGLFFFSILLSIQRLALDNITKKKREVILISIIFCSVFAKVDQDGDQTVSISEVESLIQDIKSGKVDVEEEYAIAEVLKTFDVNKDGTITEDEFIEGCKKWIHEAKQLAEDGSSHSRKSLRQASKFLVPNSSLKYDHSKR